MAIKVHVLELSEGLQAISGCEGYDSVRVLIRYHAQPIGWLIFRHVNQAIIPVDSVREMIGTQLGWELVTAVISAPSAPEPGATLDLPPISIVVCTRDRTHQFVHCLEGLIAVDYPDYEIVVVDNAPRDNATAELAMRYPVRYVREERPGLDWARNRGVAESRHDIVAFTDDDAVPDRKWLHAIARTFADADVVAVTGLVVPAELETDAQVLFELGYGGMGHGLRRRTISRKLLTDRNLLWASSFGVGANMAFRRHVFTELGLFDVALDVGTPSGGGGDVEMFHRIVAAGRTLVYEPSVLVWHTHRRDMASLRRLLYNNGRSFGVYLLTAARNQTVPVFSIMRFAAYDWIVAWLLRRLLRRGSLPRQLVIWEAIGAITSPRAYVVAQRHAHQIATDPAYPVLSHLDVSTDIARIIS